MKLTETAADVAANVEGYINQLVNLATRKELENAQLKRVIRVMAGSIAWDEAGNQTMSLTAEQADYVKRVCDQTDVFKTGGIENDKAD